MSRYFVKLPMLYVGKFTASLFVLTECQRNSVFHCSIIPKNKFPADSPVIPRRFPVPIPRSHSPFPFPIPIPRFPVLKIAVMNVNGLREVSGQ